MDRCIVSKSSIMAVINKLLLRLWKYEFQQQQKCKFLSKYWKGQTKLAYDV